MRINILLAILGLFLISCDALSTYDQAALVGSWEAVEWKNLSTGELIPGQVSFSFDDDGRYKAKYGDYVEQGKYWMVSDNLHTVEDGMAEKKVKIEKLTADSLVFGMNRMGQLEKLVLIRQ